MSPHLILYVRDQVAARDFYARVLELEPRLDVPGMTEFELGGTVLGLMPEAGIQRLIPGLDVSGGARAELYLRRSDAGEVLARAVAAGGRLLSGLEPRSWGETVGYCLDLDGHVLAVAAQG